MFLFVIGLLVGFGILAWFCIRASKEENSKIKVGVFTHVLHDPKKTFNIRSFEDTDEFGRLVIMFAKENNAKYRGTVTRQVSSLLRREVEQMLRLANNDTSLSLEKLCQNGSTWGPPCAELFKSETEGMSSHRYHIVQAMNKCFVSKHWFGTSYNNIVYAPDSNLVSIVDRIEAHADSSNGFNDKYANSIVFFHLAVVQAVVQVLKNQLNPPKSLVQTPVQPEEDYLDLLEKELKIVKPSEVPPLRVEAPKIKLPVKGIDIAYSQVSTVFSHVKSGI